MNKTETTQEAFVETPEQKQAFEKVLESLKKTPGPLMGALQEAQGIYGYLPIEIQNRIAEYFNIPLADVYGVVTFYSQFNLTPKGKYKVGVCMGTACYVLSAGPILEKLKNMLGLEAGGTDAEKLFTLEATRCIGCCGLAPVITVNEDVYGKLKIDDLDGIINKYREIGKDNE
ncbi:MAG: NAD(P)H-dependent oxidoreductase subunit E [Firmicutes bacterium]|nr:NAD(P)H-dependent oxidoreductase subunit E [Bacillota bacterium]